MTPRLYSELAWLWPVISPAADYEEEAATFHSLLARYGVQPGGTLLHLGSGGGSLDFHLKRSWRVTGVDVSDAMREQARQLNPDVEYVAGDMRTIRLGRSFDAVLVHDAISYMTSEAELRAVYRTAAAHLDEGGVLIALPEELRSRLRAAQPAVHAAAEGDRTVWLIELCHDPDPTDTRFEEIYVFVVRDDAGVRVEVDTHTQGVFELSEFVAAVEAAGFRVTVEAWDLATWAADEEPLPLIVGVRGAAVAT